MENDSVANLWKSCEILQLQSCAEENCAGGQVGGLQGFASGKVFGWSCEIFGVVKFCSCRGELRRAGGGFASGKVAPELLTAPLQFAPHAR